MLNYFFKMKFLNSSVNYSEEYAIKTTLVQYVTEYNKFLENYYGNFFKNDSDYFIPNNYKKYYLYITEKKKGVATLFYYPSVESKKYYESNLLVKNTLLEFFVECDITLKANSILLEGYMYNNNTTFLLSDVLFIGNQQINNPNYNERFNLLLNIYTESLSSIININMHPYMTESYMELFLNNFIYKNEIINIEKISNFIKQQLLIVGNPILEGCKFKKTIQKTKKSEIYNVYNLTSNDPEGFLYIKTLQDSIFIKNKFKDTDIITCDCIYNTNFQKWQIISN